MEKLCILAGKIVGGGCVSLSWGKSPINFHAFMRVDEL